MYYLLLIAILLSNTSYADVLKVGIVDSGLNIHDARFIGHLCEGEASKDFTGEGMTDSIGHGTHIAGLVIKYAADASYCLYIAKYYSAHASPKTNSINLMKSFQWLIDKKVKIINYSGGGDGQTPGEYELLKAHPEISFVVAAGNGSRNLDIFNYYPASYLLPNIYPIGCKHNGFPCYFSNYGSIIKDWEDGQNVLSDEPNGMGVRSGTSQSTAIATGKAIKHYK